MTDQEGLFEWDDVPVRQGSREYLIAIAGDYGGLTFWSLAPIDSRVRELYGVTADETDFVWLADSGRPRWALVEIYDRKIIALDPDPLEPSVKEALESAKI